MFYFAVGTIKQTSHGGSPHPNLAWGVTTSIEESPHPNLAWGVTTSIEESPHP